MTDVRGLKHIEWFLYLIFVVMLFIENVWLHYSCFHSILFSSLWNTPLSFWSFYLPKIFISALFASLIFFLKYKWSIVLYSLILNIWFLANCVYFRSYGAFLDVFALSMARNMDGFWGAVRLFIDSKDILYFLLSVALALLVYFIPNPPRRHRKSGLITAACSYLMCGIVIILSNYMYVTRCGVDMDSKIYKLPAAKAYFLPFSRYARFVGMGVSLEYDFSILHYIGFILTDAHSLYNDQKHKYVITEQDMQYIQPLLNKDTCQWNGGKQIIILVESLESWAIQPEVMPNVYHLLQSSSFYAPYCKSQTRAGGSADGQLIVNTGLLPIKEDAVCFRYPLNIFPSYPKGHSAVLLPHAIDVWNQVYMSPAYGYDTTIVTSMEDLILFSEAVELLDEGYDMVQIITMTSHAPFSHGVSVNIPIPDELPSVIHDYLGCLHLTDIGIGLLLDRIFADSTEAKSTTVLITGDHTVFPDDKRKQYATLCRQKGISYSIENNFVPVLIVSPTFTHSIVYADTCYQMDIYPTLLNVMGYGRHYWRGVGKNLLDSTDIRSMDEEKAYDISEQIIKANYFATEQ